MKKARLIKGYSMDQLVVQLKNQLTKGAIAKYEAGEYLPREDKMRLLVEVLGVSEDYFYKTINYEATVTSIRSKDALAEREQQMLAEEMLMTVERYLEVEQLVQGDERPLLRKMDIVPPAEPDDAELAAEFWRLGWKAGEQMIGSVYALLEQHGVVVHEMDSGLEFDGFSAYVNETIPVIVINGNRNAERRRFTALHELAHLMLPFSEALSDKAIDKLCNRFAGAALMPAKILKSILGKKRDSLYVEELVMLRNSYGISISALAHRALELGIITAGTYGRIREALESNPLEEGLGAYEGKEHSRRLESMTLRAVGQRLITQSKAAELLPLPGNELKNRLSNKW